MVEANKLVQLPNFQDIFLGETGPPGTKRTGSHSSLLAQLRTGSLDLHWEKRSIQSANPFHQVLFRLFRLSTSSRYCNNISRARVIIIWCSLTPS